MLYGHGCVFLQFAEPQGVFLLLTAALFLRAQKSKCWEAFLSSG